MGCTSRKQNDHVGVALTWRLKWRTTVAESHSSAMFVLTFYALAAACSLLYFYTRSKAESNEDPNFRSFQRSYLTVYLMAVGRFSYLFHHFLFGSTGCVVDQFKYKFVGGRRRL